jgi:ABC-type multidrug transport system fused ATPase/permease subunit
VRLESLGNAVVFSAAIASVLLTKSGKMKSGNAGWGLTQALSITGLMTWAVRCLTDLESQMMSLIRIEEITDMELELESTEADFSSIVGEDPNAVKKKGNKKKIKIESKQNKMPKENREAGSAFAAAAAASIISLPTTTLPISPHSDVALKNSGWPWKGHVVFDNVSMRYNPLSPLVLNNITLDIPAGSTLGIVGRSGSGKSSLLLALFRLVEIEGGGSGGAGKISMDGVDIRSVGLKTLRESLSIIPQDPVLFAGSILYNLDATGQASEEDAWDALRKASPDLADQFQTQQGLQTQLTEGGKNLSSGQRQLICLARALLRKSKILVLDEATSSVDPQTDAQVQATIKTEFVSKGVTVITVAHRLDTVLGYDNIAVLGAGKILEYGSPQTLLKKKNGSLRKLVIDMKKKDALDGTSGGGSGSGSGRTSSTTRPAEHQNEDIANAKRGKAKLQVAPAVYSV